MVKQFYISTWISELGVFRHVVGLKKNDTLKEFLEDRAAKVVKQKPLNKFDEIAVYTPLIANEVEFEIEEQEWNPKITTETMAKYLKGKGYVVYKKKK